MGGGQFRAQMPVKGGGGIKGLLSRIIPGSQGAGGAAINPQGFIQGATGASRATGVLQGLANPANISGMLGNVQKVLGVAQQVTPMVQQYGPLVKNLPAMLQIYRELKNGDSGSNEATATDETPETSTEGTTEEPVTNETQDTPKLKNQEQTNESVHIESKTETNSNVGKKHSSRPKRSGPRMYI
jgi:hypothetical protein